VEAITVEQREMIDDVHDKIEEKLGGTGGGM
jgi:hypothetical protein